MQSQHPQAVMFVPATGLMQVPGFQVMPQVHVSNPQLAQVWPDPRWALGGSVPYAIQPFEMPSLQPAVLPGMQYAILPQADTRSPASLSASSTPLQPTLASSTTSSGHAETSPGDGDTHTEATSHVMVSHLAPWMNEKWIAATFSKFGEMHSSELDGHGCASVKYRTVEAAQRAVRAMNGALPEGTHRALCVQHAHEQGPSRRKHHKVYISGFGRAMTVPDLRKLCKEFGELESLSVLSKRAHTDGVCFARFRDVDDAEKCCVALHRKEFVSETGETVSLTARFADVVGKHHQRRKQ